MCASEIKREKERERVGDVVHPIEILCTLSSNSRIGVSDLCQIVDASSIYFNLQKKLILAHIFSNLAQNIVHYFNLKSKLNLPIDKNAKFRF